MEVLLWDRHCGSRSSSFDGGMPTCRDMAMLLTPLDSMTSRRSLSAAQGRRDEVLPLCPMLLTMVSLVGSIHPLQSLAACPHDCASRRPSVCMRQYALSFHLERWRC